MRRLDDGHGSRLREHRSPTADAFSDGASQCRFVTQRTRAQLAFPGELLSVTVVALLVVATITWPVARDLDDRYVGFAGDSTVTIAWFWRLEQEEGYEILGKTRVLTNGAPFGWEEGNGVKVQWAFPYYPAYFIAKSFDEVVAYNFVIFSGLVLSAVAMYALVRRLGASPLVAAWSGLVFLLFPWHIEKAQGHAFFVHLEGFPLLLLAAVAWQARPVPSRALALAGSCVILATTSGYFALMALVAAAVLLAVAAYFHAARGVSRVFLRLLLGGGACLGAVGVVYVLARAGSIGTGFWRPKEAAELRIWGARLWEYVLPSYRNPFFDDDFGGWLLRHLHGSNPSETTLFVGWLTLALAAAWLTAALVSRGRLSLERRYVAVAFPALVAVAVLFSLPSPLTAGGSVPGPARLLWELSPQFRVSSRFGVLAMAALVPVAALGLEAVRRRLTVSWPSPVVRHAVSVAVCALAVALSVAELAVSPIFFSTPAGPPPPEYEQLQKTRAGIVAEYPLARAIELITYDYLFLQRYHGRPLLNGAPDGTFSDAVRQVVVDPAAPGTAEALAALGVTAAIVRPSTYVFTGGGAAPMQLGRGYRHIGRSPTGTSVWEVVADPAPALAVFTEGFWSAETPPGGATARWMTSDRARIDLVARRAGTYRARFFVSSYAQPRKLEIRGRDRSTSFVVGSGRNIVLPLRLPRGRSSLELTSLPGPQPVPDGRTVALSMSNWRFEAVARVPRGGLLIPFS